MRAFLIFDNQVDATLVDLNAEGDASSQQTHDVVANNFAAPTIKKANLRSTLPIAALFGWCTAILGHHPDDRLEVLAVGKQLWSEL